MSDSVFSGFSLDPRLMQALEKMTFEEPTPVQAAAIPVALTGKDLLVGAETGSGKTAAFVLPMLNRLLEKSAEAGRVDKSGTRALILVPTRELAIQVVKQCDTLASCSHLKTGLIIGGNSFKYQQAMFRKNPEIIVATPGRMAEHIGHGSTDLKDIEVLVLDEADRMLDLGLGADVIKIANNCNKPRQTMLFSATLTHKAFSAITQNILHNPEIIKLNSVREKHTNIVQQIILADDRDHKDRLLDGLFAEQTFDKALIFCNTRAQATRLCGLLRYRTSGTDKLRSGLLHGDMSQDERKDTVNKLRGGNINIVVATDVAARGLDVKGIDIVVNYDMPRNGTDYTHRIGRTGRAGEEGLA
ncbi:MAG: DEAD/DEAH box helicase, partial [Pseudomonadales bacterium]